MTEPTEPSPEVSRQGVETHQRDEAWEQANRELPRRELVLMLWRYGPTMEPDVAGQFADALVAAGWCSPAEVAEQVRAAEQRGREAQREAFAARSNAARGGES